MKNLLPLVFLLFAANTIIAQNWSPFTPGTVRYFMNSHGYVRAARIDSITASGNDIIYHHFRTPRGNYYDWQTPLDSNGGSWLGKAVIEKPDGTFLFDNNWNDTIVINTKAELGDSWVFYHDSSSYHYLATVTAFDTMTILGIFDSVKRIKINAWDSLTLNPDDSLDGFEIILSKSQGFVQVFDLYTFPYHPHDTSYAEGWDFYTDMMLGNTPLSKARCIFNICDYNFISSDIQHDWQAGDVYYYGQSLLSGFFVGPPYYNYFHDTIQSVSYIGNEGSYLSSGWIATRINNSIYTVVSYDTMPACSNFCDFTAGTPEEHRMAGICYYYPMDTAYGKNTPLYSFSSIPLSFDWMQVIWLGYEGWLMEFKTGVGMVHALAGTRDKSEKQLIYYDKSGTTWGVFNYPDTATAMHVHPGQKESSLRFFPNPVIDILNIETALTNYNISLSNTIGQQVFIRSNCTGKQQVDLSNFAPGIYYLRLETTDRKIIDRKIAVQN
jgi:hypothetical protein